MNAITLLIIVAFIIGIIILLLYYTASHLLAMFLASKTGEQFINYIIKSLKQ